MCTFSTLWNHWILVLHIQHLAIFLQEAPNLLICIWHGKRHPHDNSCLCGDVTPNNIYTKRWFIALAGNRTRVNCLEGSYAHHYTTNACLTALKVPTKLQDYTVVSPYLKCLKKPLQIVWQTCTLSSFWMFANCVADVQTFGNLNALNFSAPHPTPVYHSSRSI